MTLHHQILTDAVADRSSVFRLKALCCEQRARETTEPGSTRNWEELAIEWHTMANLAARLNGEIAQAEIA
jgi:hypothetical protein